MLFVISIVPFLSAVAIAFLYVSGFWIAIISGGRLSHALMLLGRNENVGSSRHCLNCRYFAACLLFMEVSHHVMVMCFVSIEHLCIQVKVVPSSLIYFVCVCLFVMLCRSLNHDT